MMSKKVKLRLETVAWEMERFNEPLPLDYDEFVRNEVLPTYIFYNGKKGTGYCTTCRNDFKVKGLRHRRMTTCPICGRRGEARSEGVSRTTSENYWSMYFFADGADLLVRYFHHNILYCDYRAPKIMTTEKFRAINTRTFMFEERHITAYHQWDIYRDSAFNNYMTPRNSDWYLPNNVTVYGKGNIEKLAETLPPEYKYAPLETLCAIAVERNGVEGFAIKDALSFYKEFPFVEQLAKSGLKYLIRALWRNYDNRVYFDTKQTELVKILKLDKRRYTILQSISDAQLNDLRLLQDFPSISPSDFYWLRNQEYYSQNCGEHLQIALKYASISKARKYITKNNMRVHVYWWRSSENVTDPLFWRDYLRNCEELGIDLNDEYYLFPKDLKKAHDEIAERYKKHRDEIAKKKREKENALIAVAYKDKAHFAPFNLHYCGMFIRLPKNGDEIKKEGEVLHHCVGGYVGRVARGETTILFIRREEAPDEPYYTLEWNGRIVQCYGRHDTPANEEVRSFERELEKAIEKEYAKTRKAA